MPTAAKGRNDRTDQHIRLPESRVFGYCAAPCRLTPDDLPKVLWSKATDPRRAGLIVYDENRVCQLPHPSLHPQSLAGAHRRGLISDGDGWMRSAISTARIWQRPLRLWSRYVDGELTEMPALQGSANHRIGEELHLRWGARLRNRSRDDRGLRRWPRSWRCAMKDGALIPEVLARSPDKSSFADALACN